MTSTAPRYTTTLSDGTVRQFARKDAALAWAEKSGLGYAVTSPKGTTVAEFVLVSAPADPEVAALQARITVRAVASIEATEDSLVFRTASGRNIAPLEEGSDERARAERIQRLRAAGNTVQDAADIVGVSKATARRLINALALTLELEAIVEEDGLEVNAA
jgi:hypothetical protein